MVGESDGRKGEEREGNQDEKELNKGKKTTIETLLVVGGASVQPRPRE